MPLQPNGHEIERASLFQAAPPIDALRQQMMNLDATVTDILSKFNVVGFLEGITREFWANAGQEGHIVSPHDECPVYSYSPGEAEMRAFVATVKKRLQENLGLEYVISVEEDYQYEAKIFKLSIHLSNAS